jgi:Carbohydrate esterase, sialic acid-specific acetylesterase
MARPWNGIDCCFPRASGAAGCWPGFRLRPRVALLLALGVAALLAHGAEPEPEGAALRIVRPVEWAVVQRHDRAGGAIPVEVRADVPEAGAIEARVALAIDAPWHTLTRKGGTFTGLLAAPAGGWHRLEVRSVVEGAVMGMTTVERVGVGEVFIVAGQSNSANHGEERLAPATDRVVALDPDGVWRVAADPQPGASGDGGSFLPALGDRLEAELNVPIGLVACGIGATSVREWLPEGSRFPAPPTITARVRPVAGGGFESDGAAFAMLVGRMKQLEPTGFRAVLWHQGESDANQQDRSRTLPGPLYEAMLERVIRATRAELGREHPWFVARATYHVPGDESSTDIRAAQAAVCRDGLALPGPDTDALQGLLRDSGGRGVHFSGAGQRRHAEAWFTAIAPWLEARLTAP